MPPPTGSARLLYALAAALLLFPQASRGQVPPTRISPDGERESPPPPRPGEPYVRLRFAPAGQVFTLAFSPDGRALAVCTTNRAVKLWSTETGLLLKSLPAAGGPVSKLLWSPDGRALAGYSPEQRAFYFWDVEAGELKARTAAHRKELSDAAWAAGRGVLLTLDEDRWLRAWDARTGRPVYERRLKGLKGLTFSPGGDVVLVFREYERPELLDPLTGGRKAELGTQRVNPFFGAWLARFSHDGRRLLFRDGTKRLTLRDVATGRESVLPLARQQHDFFAAEFSRDGRRLALVRQPFTWSLRSPNEVQVYDLEAAAGPRVTLKAKGFGGVSQIVWAEDGGTLAAAGSADPKLFDTGRLTAYTWRVADGGAYAAFPLEEPRGGYMVTLRETADKIELLAGGRVLLTYNRESVKFWDARAGRRLFRREADHVAVSPDRRFVATAAAGAGRAQVWEAVAP